MGTDSALNRGSRAPGSRSPTEPGQLPHTAAVGMPETAHNQQRVRGMVDPGESLADLFPELAAEWHPTKNVAVPGSRHEEATLGASP